MSRTQEPDTNQDLVTQVLQCRTDIYKLANVLDKLAGVIQSSPEAPQPLQVKTLSGSPYALLTTKAGDTGYDLYVLERINLFPGKPVRIRHGIAIELPEGYAATIRPRSSSLFRQGEHGDTPLHIAFGSLDNSYRGEIMTAVINIGDTVMVLEPGERISQLTIEPVVKLPINTVETLSDTERGEGGFGSTGK